MGFGEYICELTDLQDGTKYYARAYATNAKGTSYGEEVNFTTSDMVDAIDLGLSVKWASCNIGANSPEELGDYFAWGEVKSKDSYEWSNYKWGNAESGQLTKYNWSTDYGTPDYKYVLDPEDDAATVNWGGKWRMPTKEEYDELIDKCSWESVSRNGMVGREITASNGNKIFLPVQETSPGGYWDNAYWLSVLSTENANSAWYILMYGYSPYDNIQLAEKKWRHERALIRPVYDDSSLKKDKPTVVTQTSMQVTKNSAVVGGDVINNGGASLLECGIIYGTSSSLTISNTKVKNNNLSLSNFYCVLSGLKENTKYYVRAYAINHEGLAYGSVESFTTQTKATATPEAVDIGLSVKWASFNVGASKPEEYGDYFAWGETEPKEMYNGSNYKWGNPDGRILTKYSTSVEYGFIDNKYTLDLEDDAAAVNLGGKWRMPTPDEFGELINTCTAKWTSLNGVKGYEIMGPNGESIFLPAAGYSHDHDGINCIEGVGRDVHCWSNTLSDDPYNAVICRFENGENYIGGGANARTEGRSVRAVYDEPITTKFPSVNINTFSNIADVSVVVECEVTDNGGASITERGIVYSTLEMPTISHNSKIMNGSGVGSYSCQITNLEPETSYYVRAYAINARGVSYSNQVRFRTLSPAVLPTVTTHAVTQVTEATAVAGGNVTSDGNGTITERGVCVATVSNPTTSNTKVTAGSGKGSFTCNLTGLQANTTYYVRAYAVNSKGTAYGEEISFTTNSPSYSDPTGTANGHGYVDLGLSVKWATCNVGANKPEDYGDHFAWGETEPKTTYDFSTYKWCNGSYNTLTKYNTTISFGVVDNKTILEPSDDAATVNWGAGTGGTWRMPTYEEMTELRTECTWTWTAQNGVEGYIVTSQKNGNSIFLPAAGHTSLTDHHGFYWTSSLCTNYTPIAYNVAFHPDYIEMIEKYYRFMGFSVRPVYGDPVEIEAILPTVTTTAATQVTETTAVTGGNVTSDGNASVTERGVCIAIVPNPTTSDTKISAGSGTGSFTCNLTGLQANTTYYVRAYAVNSKRTAYGQEISFTTKSPSYSDPTGTENGHGYVDLGLSVKWATYNVGASGSKPEDYGDYFAWGETEPKTSYSESNYSYTDNPTTLPLSADAAHVNWGGSWRMPTDAEMTELREQCTWTWTTYGYKVTSKKNGNSIFLPAAGYRDGSSLGSAGSYGFYWSSSPHTSDTGYAWGVDFGSYYVDKHDAYRYYGHSVRPVCP